MKDNWKILDNLISRKTNIKMKLDTINNKGIEVLPNSIDYEYRKFAGKIKYYSYSTFMEEIIGQYKVVDFFIGYSGMPFVAFEKDGKILYSLFRWKTYNFDIHAQMDKLQLIFINYGWYLYFKSMFLKDKKTNKTTSPTNQRENLMVYILEARETLPFHFLSLYGREKFRSVLLVGTIPSILNTLGRDVSLFFYDKTEIRNEMKLSPCGDSSVLNSNNLTIYESVFYETTGGNIKMFTAPLTAREVKIKQKQIKFFMETYNEGGILTKKRLNEFIQMVEDYNKNTNIKNNLIDSWYDILNKRYYYFIDDIPGDIFDKMKSSVILREI